MKSRYDAVVVGAGPNGLAAAICLARAGYSVHIVEASDTPGGGARTREVTLPGFHHDICSAVHPLAVSSPFFRSLRLEQFGLEWVYPDIEAAHPVDDSQSACLVRSVEQTADWLGGDRTAYERLVRPFVSPWEKLAAELLAPAHIPSHPLLLARFARRAVRSASSIAHNHFSGSSARALWAGLAAHSMLPLDAPISAAVAMVLANSAHAVGWPFPRGGAQRITDALVACAQSVSVSLDTNHAVRVLADVPEARVTMFDVTPRQLVDIFEDGLPERARKQLIRFRYGPGVFKIDWALSQPVPFLSEACRKAGTVHIGGTFEEIAESEELVWQGTHPDRPFVLFAQPTVFDPSRAPAGKHVAWGYCHVPSGSDSDMTELVERQVERFAPGFRDVILARHTITAAGMERYNSNYVGGDINGGVLDWRQLFVRPLGLTDPYRMPLRGVYLCSSSTPPGGGVHGMCGYHAAQSAIRFLSGR